MIFTITKLTTAFSNSSFDTLVVAVASMIFLCVHTAVVTVFSIGGTSAALAYHHGSTDTAKQLGHQQIVVLRLMLGGFFIVSVKFPCALPELRENEKIQ